MSAPFGSFPPAACAQARVDALAFWSHLTAILADANAESHAMIRVIDEENEDYLYPASWFVPSELPAKVERAILELVDH